MALGTSCASILNASLLCWILSKRGLFKIERKVLIQCAKILASSVIMSAILIVQQKFMQDSFMNHGFTLEAVYIMILIISGVASFFAALRAMGGYRLVDVISMIRNRT